MYDELLAELWRHRCDAKEDDRQEVCEECAYDVIIEDKSVPSGIGTVCVCGLMHRAADAIEELSKPQWIPVAERLPEEEGSVLIFSKLGGIAEGHYSQIYGIWTQYRWNVKDSKVTHWMPLPEPPKGDE